MNFQSLAISRLIPHDLTIIQPPGANLVSNAMSKILWRIISSTGDSRAMEFASLFNAEQHTFTANRKATVLSCSNEFERCRKYLHICFAFCSIHFGLQLPERCGRRSCFELLLYVPYSAFANSCPLQTDTFLFHSFIATKSDSLQTSFSSVMKD